MSSQFYVTFFLHLDHCQSSSLSTPDFTSEHVSYSPFLLFFVSKEKTLRSRSSSKSSRSSTRYELIHANFVERCFVVLRVRILIIEFSTDVLIFHSFYSPIEFWYPTLFEQQMERDYRTLWKWDQMEIRHVFCPRRNVLVTCPLSNYWDECIRLEKTMIPSGLSSDASYCQRIHSYVSSQELKHVTLPHSQRNRSSSSRWIIIHWMFPSTSIDWRYHDQKRHGHDRNNCHNTDEIHKVVQQELVLYNCLFCLVIVKVTCYCHVRSEIVVTKHTDTQVRKRFGRIEFTRRRFTFISSKSVQHTRLRSNFQCHRAYLWEDPSDCHVSQKYPRSSNQVVSLNSSRFPDKEMSWLIGFCKIEVRTFTTTLEACHYSKILRLRWRSDSLTCIFWRVLDVWSAVQIVTISVWQT